MNRYITFVLLILTVAFCVTANIATAQEVTGSHKIKWISVGSLQSWFSNAGAEVEYGRRGRASAEAYDQTDQLRWDAQFEDQDRQNQY